MSGDSEEAPSGVGVEPSISIQIEGGVGDVGGEEWGSAVGLGFRSAWGVKWCGGGWASELAGWAVGPVGQGAFFCILVFYPFMYFISFFCFILFLIVF